MIDINNNGLPRVGFCTAIKNGFLNYSNFSGRIRRSEFWFFILFDFIWQILLLILTLAIRVKRYYNYYDYYNYYYNYRYSVSPVMLVIDSIFESFMILPIASAVVRRLHDIGKNGCNAFIIIVPISGFIVLLIYLASNSETKTNKYGPSPKYPQDVENLLEPLNNNTSNINRFPLQQQNQNINQSGYSLQLNLVPIQNNNAYVNPNSQQQNVAPLLPQQNPIPLSDISQPVIN